MGNYDFNNEEEEESINIIELVDKYEKSIFGAQYLFFELDDYEAIIDYYQQMGRSEDALAVTEQSLEQYPYSAGLLTRKAQFLFEKKQIELALQLLDTAEMYESSETGIYILRAEIFAYQSRYEDAIDILKNLLLISSQEDLPDVYLQMCDVYEDWEKYFEVYDCLVACLDIDPMNEEALNRFNFCIEITDRYEDSLPIHLNMIDENPYNYLAWYNLASTYRGMNLYEKSVDAFEYALAINDDDDFMFQELAELHFKNGQYQKSLDVIKDLCETFEADDEIYFLQGKCHEALGNNKMARYCFRKAVHDNPAMSEAYFRIGETYKIEGLWEQAYKSFQKANELEKEQYEFCLAMAEAALEIGESDVALDACETAIDLFMNRYEAYFVMAKIMAMYSDTENALEIIFTGLKICKSTIELNYARCAIEFMDNRNKEAEILLRQLLQENFDLHELLYDFCAYLKDDNLIQQILAE